jgi:GTPase SAR1 family protein
MIDLIFNIIHVLFQRPLFRHYYKGTDAVVMVIDSSDRERLDELYCDVLKPALHADELANSVFLFLVNKRDLPNTLDKDEVAAKLNLQSIKHIWSEFIYYNYILKP